ncbi:MAG: DUF4428 domain-containing protein [Oscillospiraceae bacterium]|nr:DUF4428 domain-containing protein [Oscillospiraceae bacterium]
MAFFGKLFEKKVCDLCGGEIGLLGNKKLEDGNCCKECAGKLSPWFDERRHSTVEQIRRQLTARGENRQKLQTWNHDLVFGEYQKLYVKFLGKIPDTFVISSASNYKEANADILQFAHVSSCDADIRESHKELKQKNAQGEEISFNPPRYEYSYEFYVKLMIMGCEYIDDMRFRLNRNTLKLQTVQSPNGRGLKFSRAFDPMHYPEYRELKNELDTVCNLFSCGQRGMPYEGNATGGDGIQSLLEQIRNAPDLETAMQLHAALALMTIANPNKDHINAQAAQALAEVKNRCMQGNASANRPAASGQWVCRSCGSQNTGKFCSGCGNPRPVQQTGWKCFCGTMNTGRFCNECGTSRFEPRQIWCSECSWTIEEEGQVPKFCPNCGKKFNNDDIR